MVRWVVGSILHGVDPLSYFSFQPVPHGWCNKGRGMYYPVCGMVHIKEPLLLIDNYTFYVGVRTFAHDAIGGRIDPWLCIYNCWGYFIFNFTWIVRYTFYVGVRTFAHDSTGRRIDPWLCIYNFWSYFIFNFSWSVKYTFYVGVSTLLPVCVLIRFLERDIALR